MLYTIIGGDGKEYGGTTPEELRKWIAEGRLDAKSLVKAESDAEFRPLSTFPEFADAFAPPSLASAAPPTMMAGEDGKRAAVLQRVKAPSVALLVTAILDIIFGLWGLVRAIFPPNMDEFNAQLQQLNNPQLQAFFDKIIHLEYGPIGMAGCLLGLLLSALILMGALKMQSLRSYEFCVTAAILALLPCVTPCCLIGLPFGIWALVVLRAPEVRSQFR
jgi:hypothetical protein